jgi:hypothetical protein
LRSASGDGSALGRGGFVGRHSSDLSVTDARDYNRVGESVCAGEIAQ